MKSFVLHQTTVSDISGNIVTPHSKILLKVSLSPLEPDICDHFYIAHDISFSVDIFISYYSMVKFSISLFSSTYQIAQNGIFIPASPPPGSHLSPIVSIATPTLCADSHPSLQFCLSHPQLLPSSPRHPLGQPTRLEKRCPATPTFIPLPPSFLIHSHTPDLGQLC